MVMKKVLVVLVLSFLVFAGCKVENVEKEVIVEQSPSVIYPIDNFEKGGTLKPFGIYITQKTSPVQPERFSGYHTGVDVEMPEELQDKDVPVYAIAEGVVKLARTASGYGGVMAVQYEIDQQPYIAVYGHIDLKSVSVSVGDTVSAGQQLAILGEGFSVETDGERKHLHFAMKPGTTVDLKGYVDSESSLKDWIDPMEFLLK